MAASSSVAQRLRFVVIGAGSGGIAAARRAAAHLATGSDATTPSVGVIERTALGGTCVNVGCVPKKVMYNAAEMVHSLNYLAHYGINAPASATASSSEEHSGLPLGFTVDLAKLKASRDAYVTRLNGIYKSNLEKSGVTILRGVAKFVGPHTLSLDDGTLVEAEHVLIATGSVPDMPHVEGIEHAISSDGVWQLSSVPRSMVVVGGGYIACELAGVFHSLGSRVTMVLRGKGEEAILRKFDSMIRSEVRAAMLADGINIVDDFHLARIQKGEDGKMAVYSTDGRVADDSADVVLVATGRKPETRNLNLAAAGVDTDEHGAIKVDAFQNTSAPGVYCVGDATGHHQLTPVAIAAGRLLADRLFGGVPDARLSYGTIPSIVFTHPPVGTVGLSEEEAKEAYGAERVKVFTSKFAPLFYGIVANDSIKRKTAMKLVCVRDAHAPPSKTVAEENAALRVAGLHVVGDAADEMLQGFAVAVKMRATKADFDSSVALHPTSAEEFVTMPTWAPHLLHRPE